MDEAASGRKLFTSHTAGFKEEFHTLEGEVIESEVIDMCYFIAEIGTHTIEGTYEIKFGQLFRKIYENYTKIATRFMKILKKGRKMNLIEFEGEMLYQGQDDDKIITLLGTPPKRIKFLDKSECAPVEPEAEPEPEAT